MPINQNQSLYSLLGANFGGDGTTSFALPDLRGRTPMHTSDSYPFAQQGGTESVALTAAEIPPHSHTAKASSALGDSADPSGHVLAATAAPDLAYRNPEAGSTTALHSGTVANAGGGQTHNNMQPYTTVSFCIALRGIYPSRN